MFPGLNNLPQVAASTFGDLASSSSNNVASTSGQGGFLDGVVDTLAGFIATATGRKWFYAENLVVFLTKEQSSFNKADLVIKLAIKVYCW